MVSGSGSVNAIHETRYFPLRRVADLKVPAEAQGNPANGQLRNLLAG
jgi:hypothetical protein